MKKIIIASFIGALLEWYDFFIFGTAAGIVFGPLFFPDKNPMLSTLASFATFGVGFITRPLGGIIFGHFGDKYGRKKSLLWTLIITGLSTFLIGLLPTYQQVGFIAPILLASLRLIQGFGLGGEYAGASLITLESSPVKKRGFFGSLPQTAASAGIMLATAIFAICHALFTNSTFNQWGWRIPFLISIIMLMIGIFIRSHLHETAAFKAATAKTQKNEHTKNTHVNNANPIPLVALFKNHCRNTLLALGARLAETVSSNIINAFAIAYVSSQLMLNKEIPLLGIMFASIIGLFFCPLIGWFSDKIGQKPIYIFGAAFCIVFAFPFFGLLNTGNTLIIWVAMIIGYNFGPTVMFSVQPTLFAQLFGTKVRYTGLSFAYQVSAIIGGLTPLIVSSLLFLNNGKPWYVAIYFLIISIISFICVLLIKSEKKSADKPRKSHPSTARPD